MQIMGIEFPDKVYPLPRRLTIIAVIIGIAIGIMASISLIRGG